MTPPGTRFTELLHGILPTFRIYVYVYVYSPAQRRNFPTNSASTSISHSLPCLLSNTSPVIGIGSFALVAGSKSIRLTNPHLTLLAIYDLIHIAVSDLIRLILSIMIWLTVSELIWLAI